MSLKNSHLDYYHLIQPLFSIGMVFSKLGLLKWMDLLLLHSALLSQAIPSCKADLIPDLLVLLRDSQL